MMSGEKGFVIPWPKPGSASTVEAVGYEWCLPGQKIRDEITSPNGFGGVFILTCAGPLVLCRVERVAGEGSIEIRRTPVKYMELEVCDA